MTRKLKVNEAAALLRLSPKTLYAWASAKKIPHYKVGGCLFFDEAALEKWLEQCEVRPEGGEGKKPE